MNRLEEIRKRVGFSNQGLAVKAKVSTSTVTAIEKWGYVPQLRTCRKIADALEVVVEDIWDADQVIEEGSHEHD